MFGRSDDKTENTNDIPDESIHGALESEPAEADQTVVTPGQPVTPSDSVPADTTSPAGDDSWQHPGTPLDNKSAPISDVTTLGAGKKVTTFPSLPTPPKEIPAISHHESPDSTPSEVNPHELIDIKQQALGQLSPLIDHLDQSPEEKFRTLMMMIQASDDQGMIKTAYQAANDIADEKARAQALLDIVNEINYFTTQHQS